MMRELARRVRLIYLVFDLRSLLPHVLGGAAIVLAVAVPTSWVTTVVFLAGIAYLAWLERIGLGSRPFHPGTLGAQFAPREVLLAAVVARLAVTQEMSASWVVAIALTACTLLGEQAILEVRRHNRISTANVPGASGQVGRPTPYVIFYPLNLLILAAMSFAPPVGGYLAISLAVISGLALTAEGLVIARLIGRVRARRGVDSRRNRALKRTKPVFYVYWEASPNSGFQISMWLPYLERLNLPYAFIVRRPGNMHEAWQLTDRPIFLCRDQEELDKMVLPCVRGVFYVNNAGRNLHMIRYTNLKHIQLNHGESDKAASINRAMRMYDRDFVAGQAAIDRFAANGISIPRDTLRIVGRPQVEGVNVAAAPISQVPHQTVLYAPTWVGYNVDANYSSLFWGEHIVKGLLARGCTVIFRPHPYTSTSPTLTTVRANIIKMLSADATSTGRHHRYDSEAEQAISLYESFNLSDAMISDVSSVPGDFLYSEKPLAMVSTRASAADFVKEFPMAQASYVITTDGKQLMNYDEVLAQMLGDDPLSDTRRELRVYYLGDIPRDDYADRFISTARKELGVVPADAVHAVLAAPIAAE